MSRTLFRSLFIGIVAGMRALTPLATVSVAAANRRLPLDNGAPPVIGRPAVAAATVALAAAELAGDKMRSAPDRTVLPGMVARIATGAIAGAALAPSEQRAVAMLVGAAGAVGASYVTLDARRRAMGRYGQTSTGVVEDLIVIASAMLIVGSAIRARA